MTPERFLSLSIDLAFVMVIAAIVLSFVRLLRGPSMFDRVVALDMMTVLIVAFCAIFAIFSGQTAFLDVAIVLALVGFLATVALARYAERNRKRRILRERAAGEGEAGEGEAGAGEEGA